MAQFDINSNVLTPSGFTADQLNGVLVGTGLTGLGGAFKAAENAYGINAVFMIAHAAIESAWGTSYFAVNRNNLFGLNAYDSNPDMASSYPSKVACIDYYGHFLKTYYLTPGAVYSNGDTPHGIFVRYSSSHDSEAQSVVNIWNDLDSKIAALGAPAAPASIPSPSSGRTYTVVKGDTLSGIAYANGLSLARLEQINPQIKNPNLIFPGQVINLTGATVQSTATTPVYVTVQPGDTLSGIASNHGITLAQVEELNPSAGHPAGNFDNIWPGDQVRVK